jgi:two-component system, sensor histidine kinase SagS
LQFTELFAREVARTLHTLNLLNAQEFCAASLAIEAVNRDVAFPADDLLAVASGLIDKLEGQKDLVEPLRRILADARKIKIAIHNVGTSVARQATRQHDPTIENMRILVVDTDERMRKSAHQLLERKGCVVETSATATEGIAMAKSGTFDAVLVAVKHPDMRGTLAYRALVAAVPLGRVILTQGYGYDGDHTVVNAKTDGYWLPVLYKPFIEKQILEALTKPIPNAPSKTTTQVAAAT